MHVCFHFPVCRSDNLHRVDGGYFLGVCSQRSMGEFLMAEFADRVTGAGRVIGRADVGSATTACRQAEDLGESFTRICERVETLHQCLEELAKRIGVHTPKGGEKPAPPKEVPFGFIGEMVTINGRLSSRVAELQDTLNAIGAVI